jgi:hypothetical protein
MYSVESDESLRCLNGRGKEKNTTVAAGLSRTLGLLVLSGVQRKVVGRGGMRGALYRRAGCGGKDLRLEKSASLPIYSCGCESLSWCSGKMVRKASARISGVMTAEGGGLFRSNASARCLIRFAVFMERLNSRSHLPRMRRNLCLPAGVEWQRLGSRSGHQQQPEPGRCGQL